MTGVGFIRHGPATNRLNASLVLRYRHKASSHTARVARTADFYPLSDTEWRRSVVVSFVNAVNRHWARLVGLLGWVTVCGRVNHLGM